MYKMMGLEKYVILYGLTFSVGPDSLPAGEDQCCTAEFFQVTCSGSIQELQLTVFTEAIVCMFTGRTPTLYKQ